MNVKISAPGPAKPIGDDIPTGDDTYQALIKRYVGRGDYKILYSTP